MSKVTPSMAKGHIRRSLLQVIDKPLTKNQKQQIWHYFNNKCAYCSIIIEPSSRKGHLDHLLATTDGGTNDIHNFVLACNICNGDEKRETPWRIFLENKCKNLSFQNYQERLSHIEKWHSKSIAMQLDSDTASQIRSILEQAIVNFDKSVKEMRLLRDSL